MAANKKRQGLSRAIREPELEPVQLPRSEDLQRLAADNGLVALGGRPSLREYLAALWERRYFVLTFARSQVRATTTGNQLGAVWLILTPLLNIAVYYLIFGVILQTSRGLENFIGFLAVGVFIMGFTTGSLNKGASAIVGNLSLVRALHFPRALLPLTVVLRELLEFLLASTVMIVILLVTGEPITVKWLLVPLLLLIQVTFNAGLAFMAARITSDVPDFVKFLPFVSRVWTYLSGVMYPISKFTEGAPPWAVALLEFNPGYAFLELYRSLLMTTWDADPRLWGLAAGWAVVTFVLGFWYFWRGEETYGHAD